MVSMLYHNVDTYVFHLNISYVYYEYLLTSISWHIPLNQIPYHYADFVNQYNQANG